MIGISSTTGQILGGREHLHQSIKDILTTPKGTRVMRRDYGSNFPRLVDNPINSELILKIYAETADALRRWEPRFQIKRIISKVSQGQVTLSLYGKYLPTDTDIVLDGVVL